MKKKSVKTHKNNTTAQDNVAQRKRLEEELRESERKYRELIKYAPAGIYEVDYETNLFINVNDAICEYTGYTRDELLTMNFFNLFTEESQTLMFARLKKLMAGEIIPQTVEYCIRTKAREKLWVLLNARYIYESGKLKGATGIIYNITERKKAEEQLWATQERLKLALQVSRQGYYEWDIQNDHLYYSDQYIEILEFGRDELEPRIRSWKKMIHPQDKKAVLQALKNHIDGRTSPYEETYRLKVKSGAWRWFRDHAEVVNRDTKGSPLCMMGTITDVTPYKEFEQELEKTVGERTAELVEVNSALKILLKQREQDKTDSEETMAANLKFMVFPYLHKLKRSALNVQQKELVSLIDENLDKVSAPFIKKLSSKYSSLTPKEIQVAECIRSGKTSKEIADMMNISARTVDVLRYSVRKKLGLNNKKANLQSLLSSL